MEHLQIQGSSTTPQYRDLNSVGLPRMTLDLMLTQVKTTTLIFYNLKEWLDILWLYFHKIKVTLIQKGDRLDSFLNIKKSLFFLLNFWLIKGIEVKFKNCFLSVSKK